MPARATDTPYCGMNCLPSSLDLDHGVLVRRPTTSSHYHLEPSQSPTPGDPVTLEFPPVPLYVAGGVSHCVLMTDNFHRLSHLLSSPYQAVRQVGPRCPSTVSGTIARVANPNYPRTLYRNSGAHYLHTLKQSICVNSTLRSIGSSPSRSTTSWTRFCRSFTRVT